MQRDRQLGRLAVFTASLAILLAPFIALLYAPEAGLAIMAAALTVTAYLLRDALIAAGGTITHHHAVGRDHRPWYDRQRPPLFAAGLRAVKHELDPRGILNPGVLIDAAG